MNYVEQLLVLVSAVTGCVSISAFASLVDIASSTVGLKICVITTGIKQYKSLINKKKRKHDKMVLLGKSKFNIIEVLTSKALTDSNTTH